MFVVSIARAFRPNLTSWIIMEIGLLFKVKFSRPTCNLVFTMFPAGRLAYGLWNSSIRLGTESTLKIEVGFCKYGE